MIIGAHEQRIVNLTAQLSVSRASEGLLEVRTSFTFIDMYSARAIAVFGEVPLNHLTASSNLG